MTREEQLRIAHEIADTFAQDLIEMVNNIPEEWDGFEIRQLAIDHFTDQFGVNPRHDFSNRRTKRRRDYEQTKFTVIRGNLFKKGDN